MDKGKIRQIVIETLTKFAASLDKDVPKMTDGTNPIDDLGLCSEDGVDWVSDIEVYGFEIPPDVNPFRVELPGGRGRHRYRNVGEIVDFLQGYVAQERK